MNDPLRELDRIKTRLYDMADDQFLRLVRYVERAQQSDKNREFANDAMATMRPRLRVSRPPRRLTIERVFARPFEDLLYDSGVARKRTGRIARRAVTPCWALIAPYADQGQLARALEAIDRFEIGDPDWPIELGPVVWPLALSAVTALLSKVDGDTRARRDIVAGLEDPSLLDEVREMAGMLAVAETTEGLRRTLAPKPIKLLDEGRAETVVAAFREFEAEKDARWPYLAYFVIGRMADPVELARAYGGSPRFDPALQFLGALAAKVTMDEVGSIVDELTDAAQSAGTSDHAVAQSAAEAAERLARLHQGMRERRIGGSVEQIERMQKGLRTAVSEKVLSGTDELIKAALAVPSGAATTADGGSEADAARESAEERARALWKCKGFASKIGMEREVQKTVRAVETSAERLVLDLLSSLEGGNRSEAEIEAAESSLMHAVRVVELVAGPERANELRMRGLEVLNRVPAGAPA